MSLLQVMIEMENQNPKSTRFFGIFSHDTSLVNSCYILDDSSSNTKQIKLALLTRVPKGSKVVHGHSIHYEYFVKSYRKRNAYLNNLDLPYCRSYIT